MELVKCETVDLHVPANAEIVLEGEMPPLGWTADEGPYGEFTGTHGGLYPGWTDLHVIFPK